MRWVNIGVIVAVVAVILIFVLQNLESVTMSFLGFRISAPLAVVAVVLYLLRLPWRRRSARSSGKRHQRSAYRPIVRFRSICRKPGAGRGCRSVVSVDS